MKLDALKDSRRQFSVGATKNLFDELIDRHAEAYMSEYPEVKEFGSFERSATGNYYIGMVHMDNCEKPDIKQFKIRGSYSLTANKMIELDLSAIDSQQIFFPGQIIAFHGEPFLQKQLKVRKLLDPMRIAPRLKTFQTDEALRIMIASGPFMKPEQNDWTLYEKIIEQVKAQNASHLILIGPFVDLENKAIRSNYDVNWRQCFDKIVEGLHDHRCDVYLIPSSRDVLPSYLSATYFYPSPKIEFDYKLKEEPKCRITSVTDPSQIEMNGIFVDVTSAEVLFQLNKCSSFVNKGGNAFSSIYRQLLAHGIFPIYPAPSDIAVDYPKLASHIQIDRLSPHILILPTRFNTSVCNVENRLIVTIQKSSTKKQAVLIDIPKQDEPTDSVVITDYSHKILDLVSSNSETSD